MTNAAGGIYRPRVDGSDLRDVPHDIARSDFTSFTITNQTTGETVQQIDVGLDGSFSARVPVQPGVNRVSTTVIWRDGTQATAESELRIDAPSDGAGVPAPAGQ